jgi:hypothetical protein
VRIHLKLVMAVVVRMWVGDIDVRTVYEIHTNFVNQSLSQSRADVGHRWLVPYIRQMRCTRRSRTTQHGSWVQRWGLKTLGQVQPSARRLRCSFAYHLRDWGRVGIFRLQTEVNTTNKNRPTGGATKTSPATWGHPDLATYYTLKPTFTARSATRALLSATESPSPRSSKKTKVGAIAGGTVGGLLVLIGILCLILFCLHRRKKALKTKEGEVPLDLPPAELATTVPQEMADTAASKYVSIHDQADSIALGYSGHVQQQSYSVSHDYNSPYSAQGPPSYGHDPPYISPVEGGHANHSPHGEQISSDGNVARNSPTAAWSTQVNYPQSAQGQDTQYSYPTPTSPRQSSNDVIQQQVPIYYPRPNSPSTSSRQSPHSPSGNRGSPVGTQYSSDGRANHISTTSTPARFYAQAPQHESRGDITGDPYRRGL